MDVGTELRDARERAGLSREQIAQTTKIKVEKIEALEANAFDRLPRGIYLDGLVRAYAHEVGLDPDWAARRVRTSAEGQRAVFVPPPDAVAPDTAHTRRLSPALFPIALIGVLVAALALGAYWYEAARTDPPARASAAPAADAVELAPEADPEPENADRAGSVGTSGEERSDAASTPPSPAESTPTATPAPERRREPASEPRPADLSGPWTITTRVESSSVDAFEGLRLGYRVELRQDGTSVSGTGRKISENGRGIARAGQTPIEVDGTIDGDRLRLTFTERGARRPRNGTFVLTRDGGEALRGRFSSDAAKSAGSVEFVRP